MNNEKIYNKIRWFYDRLTKSYIIQVLDNNDYEIESSYVGNKTDKDFELNYLSNKYNITDINRYDN